MKKRLLVTASTFPRWQNDTEPKFIYDLCVQLQKYYDVTALVPAAPNARSEEIMEGIRIKRFSYFPVASMQTLAYPGAIVPRIKERKSRALLVPFFFIAQFFAVRRELKNCDAVLVNWFVPQGITQSFLRRKRPYIVSGLGGDVTSLNGFPVKQLKQRVIDGAGAVTVVSQDLKRTLQAEYEHTQDVNVIPMGVDLTFFGPEHQDIAFRKMVGRPIVLFVARLVEKKGARYLIEAMRDIDAKLLIVGDGPERSLLENMALELRIDCDFVGAKNKTQLRSLYASCDVFVAPSVVAADGDKDGLPVAILEAMASGAPIVASDIAGITEAVHDGENGYVTKPGDAKSLHDALARILSNPSECKHFSQHSIGLAADFDFVKIGKDYKELIDRVI